MGQELSLITQFGEIRLSENECGVIISERRTGVFSPKKVTVTFLIRAFILAGMLGVSSTAFAASRYWVGGTATWDGTTTANWSASSGGASGASVPTSSDDVYFDGNSGTGTITLSSSSVAQSITCTGFTGTISHPAATTLTIGSASGGSLTFVSGMTYTLGNAATSAISFVSTTTGNTVTTGGQTLGNVTFNGSGGGWTLEDTFTEGSTATMTLTAGTLNTNNETVSVGFFTSTNSNTRTLTLGSSSFTCTGSGTVWTMYPTVTNMTVNAGTSTIITTGGAFLSTGTFAFYNLTLGAAGSANTNSSSTFTGTLTCNGSSCNLRSVPTIANLTFTGTASKFNSYTFQGSAPTVTGTFTVNGNSATNRALVTTSGQAIGSPLTITVNGSVAASNVDFQNITAAGTASWNLSGITGNSGNCGNNSGITFTSAATQYWYGGTGTWSNSANWYLGSGGTGGSGRVPLCQDNVVFDANSFSTTGITVTEDMPRAGSNITWTGATNTPTWNITNGNGSVFSMFGSLTLISGMTVTSASNRFIYFEGTAAATLTSAGNQLGEIDADVVGSTLTIQDNLSLSGILELDGGTFNANNFNVTAEGTQFQNPNGSATRVLTMGSGTWTLNGTGTTVWNVSGSGLTINANTSTIDITDTSSTAKTFQGAGFTYKNLSITGGGSGSVTFSGSNTFNNFTINAPKTVTFTSGTTQTFTAFSASGSAGNLITINATTAGSAATLSQSSGTISSDFLSLKDSAATGGATWDAGINSINVSGNSGWNFASSNGLVMAGD